jgi:hypothetical protein
MDDPTGASLSSCRVDEAPARPDLGMQRTRSVPGIHANLPRRAGNVSRCYHC